MDFLLRYVTRNFTENSDVVQVQIDSLNGGTQNDTSYDAHTFKHGCTLSSAATIEIFVMLLVFTALSIAL